MLSPYEQKVLAEIRAWRAESPGWGARALAGPGRAVAQAVEVVVPIGVLRGVLEGADRLALRLTDRRSILQQAGAAAIEELRDRSLEECDRLARSVARRASWLGGASGAAFGVAGAAGLVADVPTLLTLALRTIHRSGLCYGEDLSREGAERQLALGVFALVSANSLEEKQAAWDALQARADPLGAAWRDGVERVAERELAKEAAVLSLQTLARRIGVNLGQRKAAGAIPVLGAAVGGAVNAWYVGDVARAARHVFRDRWLHARHPQLPRQSVPREGTLLPGR